MKELEELTREIREKLPRLKGPKKQNTMIAEKLYQQANKKESELETAMGKLFNELILYFDFSDYDNGSLLHPDSNYSYGIEEYLDRFTIVQQSDGFCFLTIYDENIPVKFVIDHIKKHGKITYNDMKNYTI
ncbi:hypothetical protein ACVVIH_12970 [Chryseobacterium arthrosphaerae]|uniref:hypothetical protein n=1 Tax=Chryseobacterium arthrosphaerae TaxID=651561 RepID=UPI00241F23B4|nr:hypothetical protein [Chryseobacterium arthrosphaerae]